VRQHSLDKDEAITHARQAKDELSLMVKRADSRIMKLQRDKQNLVQGHKDKDAREVERVISMDQAERVLAKGKRQLQIDQDDIVKQKGILDSQSASLTHHRVVKKTELKNMRTLHNKTLDHMTDKNATDREVCFFV
jgi:hypothetical protein